MSEVQKQASIKVLYVVSEALPFIKTGGLADVAGSLPIALRRANVDARVILPKYRDIPACWRESMEQVAHFYVNMGWHRQYCGVFRTEHEGMPCYFIDNEFYFARESIYGDGPEEGERFGFFCRAVIEALPYIGFFPDILHCNDWQTGLLPVLHKLHYQHLPDFSRIKTLFSIHNLKYQGVFDWQQIDSLFGLGDRYFTPEYLEFYGGLSFMKGGLVFADQISTVSETYAKEIQTPYYGECLDGLLWARSASITGILNGIDRRAWNPWMDSALPVRYSLKELSGKKRCKAALQEEFSLPVDEDKMVVALVTRLTEQKGLDLIERVLHEMMQMPIQLVIMGQGDRHYQDMFTWAQWRYQDRLSIRMEFNEPLAHRVYAGADVFLMPSRFEPCGLSQLIALRYGAVPLVRETGGLVDTVKPYNKYMDEGTGFSFANYNAHEMLFTLQKAHKYFLDKKLWERLMKRGMEQDFGWNVSAKKYVALYRKMLAPPPVQKPKARKAGAEKGAAAQKTKK